MKQKEYITPEINVYEVNTTHILTGSPGNVSIGNTTNNSEDIPESDGSGNIWVE